MLRDRLKGLWSRTRQAPTLTTDVVRHEAIDRYVFNDLKSQAPRFAAAMASKPMIAQQDGSEVECDIAPDLWASGFDAYHNAQPQVELTDREAVRPSHRVFHEIMQHFVEEDDFLKTKPLTRGDRVTAGLSAMRAQEVLEEELRNGALKEHAEQAQAMAEQEQQMAQAQAALDRLREQGQANGVDDALKAEMKAAAQAKADARQALAQLVDEQDSGTPSMTAAAAEAVANASEAAKDVAQVWTSLPGNEPGQPTRIPPDKALELAMRWRDGESLQRIALLAGKIVRDMRAARRRNIKGGKEERIGIRTGNDLSVLVPTQLVKLADPRLAPSFYKNYVDRSLLIYDTQSDEEAGRGPAVILKDVSGSMAGAEHEWATAVAMGLIGLAQRDNRAAYAINFDSVVQGEWEFGRTPDLELLTDYACHFSGGGTNIYDPMRRAEAIIDRHPTFSKADIVLITDGTAKWPDDVPALRERLTLRGVQVLGVSIGKPAASNRWVSEFCDESFDVVNPEGPNDVTRALAVATV